MVSINCLFYAAATHIHKQDRLEWKRWIRVHLVHILQSSLRAAPFKSTNTSACIRRHLQIPLAQCQKKADVESRVKYISPLCKSGVLPCSNRKWTYVGDWYQILVFMKLHYYMYAKYTMNRTGKFKISVKFMTWFVQNSLKLKVSELRTIFSKMTIS